MLEHFLLLQEPLMTAISDKYIAKNKRLEKTVTSLNTNSSLLEDRICRNHEKAFASNRNAER
jgi:hypothetical protein